MVKVHNAQKMDRSRWSDEKKLATVGVGFSSKTPTKNQLSKSKTKISKSRSRSERCFSLFPKTMELRRNGPEKTKNKCFQCFHLSFSQWFFHCFPHNFLPIATGIAEKYFPLGREVGASFSVLWVSSWQNLILVNVQWKTRDQLLRAFLVLCDSFLIF